MKCLAQISGLFACAAIAACSSHKSEKPYQAPASASYLQERIIADFDLSGVERLPTGYIDPGDLISPFRKKFPKGTPRAAIEAFVAGKTWPPDVVVIRGVNTLRVCYYQVLRASPPSVQRYTAFFRFGTDDLADAVSLLTDGFLGGRPPEMPGWLLDSATSMKGERAKD